MMFPSLNKLCLLFALFRILHKPILYSSEIMMRTALFISNYYLA